MGYMAYIGTYAKAGSEGIYRVWLDDGRLAATGTTPAVDASYLTRGNGLLYAVREAKNGGMAAYGIAGDGALTLLDETPVHGDAPCHLCVDGHHAYVANYSSGSLSVATLRTNGGMDGDVQTICYAGKGPNTARQEAPHAHFTAVTPDGAYLAVCDLGTDTIRFYPHDIRGISMPGEGVCAPGGTGPRHLAFGPGGLWYCICELTCEVLVYRGYGAKATLLQRISALARPDANASAAAVRLSPKGGQLLASVRGADTLVVFAVQTDGTLGPGRFFDAHGQWPRDAAYAPDGQSILCACERENRLTAFAVTPEGLAFTGALAVPSPVCVCF